jgi:hypothetical protein
VARLPDRGAVDRLGDSGDGVYGTGEAAYMDGNGLLHYRFTRRRKEKLVFDAEDAGKTVYVCCRYENQKGEVGQRGLAASATIPWSGIAIKALGLFPHSYHFRYIAEEQKLKNNMIIFPARTMFYSSTPHTVDELTGIYAVHWWAGSWRFNPVSKAIRKIKDNDCVRKLFGKRLKVTIEKIIKQTAHNWR